MNELSN
jgi:hypothetical protein